MGHLRQNLRFALRLLAKSPGFTVITVLTLALGIGAATTVFSVAESILWKPLAFPDSERLVTIFSRSPGARQEGLVSAPDFLDWQANSQSFSSMAAYGGGDNSTVTGGAEVVRIPIDAITTNFFSTLREQDIRGRDFLSEESQPGRNRVAIVSARFWERQFPGIPINSRQIIRLDGISYEIVGVLPPKIHLEKFGLHDISTPFPQGLNAAQQRDARILEVVARLKGGVSIRQSQLELDTLSRRLALAYPATNLDWGARVQSLRESLVSPSYRTTLQLFVGASFLLLLAACVNAAGLLLARTLNRKQEFAVRAALGAGRDGLLKQLLTESVLLGAIAGLLGITFAWLGSQLFIKLAASSSVDVPRLGEISLDTWALGFAVTISLLFAMVMGVLPAHAGARLDLNEALQTANRTATSNRQNQRLHGLFVVIQFALAAVLLVGAGLFTRSLVQLQHLDPGFSPDGVLTGSVSLSGARYTDVSHAILFPQQLEQQIRRAPEITGFAVASRLPLTGGSEIRVSIEDHPALRIGDEPSVLYSSVTPGYFDVLRIPLTRGRLFTNGDNAQGERVVVVNENFARKNFHGGEPVGHRLKIVGPPTGGEPKPGSVQIIGVTANAHSVGLDEVPFAEVYFPFAQEPVRDTYVALRTTPGPPASEHLLRAAVAALDKDIPVSDIKTMRARVSDSLGENRFNMILIAITAFMAVSLAVLGTYGVISFYVARQTREIGIRTALGAQRGNVMRMVLRQGLRLAAAGVGIGLAIALAVGKLLNDELYLAPQVHNGLLYGITPHDPLTFAAAVFVLASSAVAACYAPALRATRVDPITALRYE